MQEIEARLNQVIAAVSTVILGKEEQVRQALACLMARGHLLIEDLPGVGKTTLAHVLAKVLGLEFQRIQFTSDLLPADIIGVSVFDRESNQFKFHKGAIFAQMVLGDEINRATPKTQSALLEAMEEHQITVEGETRLLPEPFFVLATQNPTHQVGTFPLPESQLDRFMMRIELGYPDHEAERALLKGRDRRSLITDLKEMMPLRELLAVQGKLGEVKVTDALLDYLQAIIEFTRQSAQCHSGLSPRGGLALLRCAQAWALMDGRDFVIPEDIQAVFPAVAGHRLFTALERNKPNVMSRELLQQVPIP